MHHQWTHVGRLWTNGDPFLAVDATLRDAWLGFSQDQYSQVVGLGPQDASITAGTGRAAVVGSDAVVRDDSWMEVFEATGGQVAIVQAAGPDYPDVLAGALEYPDADDEDGGTLNVPSGELAIFSAAADGTGPYSMPFSRLGREPCRLFTARRPQARQTLGCCSRLPGLRTGSKSAGTPNSTSTTASRGGF